MTDVKDKMLDYLQIQAWSRLERDLRAALNGEWSIASEQTVVTLVWLMRIRPATPGLKIQVSLLKSGVYEAVCRLAGHDVSFDHATLDLYEMYWGPYEQFAKAIPHIRAMVVEDFEKETDE